MGVNVVDIPKISVITPSVRPEGLQLVKKALNRQTFQDFEWIIASPEGEKPEDLYWTVYRDYNQGLRQCRGKIVVSWQDHTFAGPDTLEKFWEHYTQEPKTIVTGVGNKYSDDSFIAQTWQDPRQRLDQGSYYKCFPNDIELNLASFPRESFYRVGGFDESLDKYSSLCGLDVLMRLEIMGGYDFKIDQTIKSFSTEHGRLPGWDEHTPFNGVWQEKLQQYIKQPVLGYLDQSEQKE